LYNLSSWAFVAILWHKSRVMSKIKIFDVSIYVIGLNSFHFCCALDTVLKHMNRLISQVIFLNVFIYAFILSFLALHYLERLVDMDCHFH
jgi:hypothetical protein